MHLYLIVDIKQHHVVSSWHHKVHPGIVSVHHLVFGPVENRVVHRQHGSYRQYFVGTFVPWQREQERVKKDIGQYGVIQKTK